MRISWIAGTLLAAAALAGCGGSGTNAAQRSPATSGGTGSSTASSTSPSTSRASSPSVSTSTTTSTATSTSAAPANSGGAAVAGAGPGECRASELALSYLGGQGASGHGELGFALRNTGTSKCSTGGYPGVEFLDQSGGGLPTNSTRTTSDFFGNLPLKPISVAPGQSVSFRLSVSHGDGSGAGCTTAYGLQAIAPNDTATLRVQIPGGASECGGATTVSPVQPGESAYR